MSNHPNVILMAVFTPDGLTRKTLKNILNDSEIVIDETYIKIGGDEYSTTIMESEYEENFQIAAKEGDIIIHDRVTYGYGEFISWSELEIKKNFLENWAKPMAEKYNCNYEVRVSANYW